MEVLRKMYEDDYFAVPCAFSLGLSSTLSNLKGRKGSKIRESGKRYWSFPDELASERVNA